MPLKYVGVDDRGCHRYVRRRFDPRFFTVPDDLISHLRAHNAGCGSRELLSEHGGPFSGMSKIREVERDGKRFVVLSRNAEDQWAIEVELTDDELGEIRALSPDEAWQIARDIDARKDPPIELEE
jgi:hypothetical protein